MLATGWTTTPFGRATANKAIAVSKGMGGSQFDHTSGPRIRLRSEQRAAKCVPIFVMDVHRRHFLLASAAAAAQTASGQTPAKVRTALIGTGNRGSYLLQGVLEQPAAEVVALCDLKPDRLDKAATTAKRDNPKTYTDWRQIVDRKDIDAVYVATPPYLHSEMAVAALKSGKNVYCEKPVGVTPAQVKSVVEAARASNRIFTAGQQLRSQRLLAEAVAKIHEGIIGDVIMIKA